MGGDRRIKYPDEGRCRISDKIDGSLPQLPRFRSFFPPTSSSRNRIYPTSIHHAHRSLAISPAPISISPPARRYRPSTTQLCPPRMKRPILSSITRYPNMTPTRYRSNKTWTTHTLVSRLLRPPKRSMVATPSGSCSSGTSSVHVHRTSRIPLRNLGWIPLANPRSIELASRHISTLSTTKRPTTTSRGLPRTTTSTASYPLSKLPSPSSVRPIYLSLHRTPALTIPVTTQSLAENP